MASRFDRWFRKGGSGSVRAETDNGSPWGRTATNYANPFDDVHIWEFQPEDSQTPSIQIVTPLPVYDAICRQAHDALPNETGGFLLGHVGRDVARRRWHLQIHRAEPVSATEANPVHFVFTGREVARVRSMREDTGSALIGWYHTHPDMGVFLSKTDVDRTHNRLFNDSFQIALVVDPVRGTAAYFCRDGNAVIESPRDEFHLEFAGDLT